MNPGSKRLLGLLSLSQFLAMMIWYNYSAVLPVLRQEWGLSQTMVGRILAAFQAGYVAVVLFAGWASDRWGAKKVFALAALETGIFGCLFPLLAHDYQSAFWLRALAGLGQGGLYVPGIRLLCDRFEGKARNTALAVYTTALVFAYAAAYFVAAPLASAYGWRFALLSTSVWAFVAAALVWWLVEEPRKESRLEKERRLQLGRLANPRAWLIILAYSGHMWELYALWGWVGAFLAAHLQAVSGYDVAAAMRLAGLGGGVVIIAGGLAPVGGSWLANRRGFTVAAVVLGLAGTVGALSLGWLLHLPTWLVMTAAILYGIIATADSSIYKAELSVSVPAEALGTFLGLQSFLGFGVTIVSTALFGQILQASNWGLAFTALTGGGVVAAVAAAAAHRIGRGSGVLNGSGVDTIPRP